VRRRLVCDATTSGGLLVAVGPDAAPSLPGPIVGEVVAGEPGASRCDDRPARATSAWSGPGPVAHPVFKTGGARHTALEGSTPSPFRMSDPDRLRDLPSVALP
jgi:hypothetical protein